MSDVCGDRDDVATIEQLTAERDTLQNRVYELEHTIQHWETDYKYWKDDVPELTAERDALREIVDHMTKHGVPPEHSYVVLRAELERRDADDKHDAEMRAAAFRSTEAHLTELREAAEAAVRHHLEWDDRKPLERLCECKDCVWCTLIAALVKVTP